MYPLQNAPPLTHPEKRIAAPHTMPVLGYLFTNSALVVFNLLILTWIAFGNVALPDGP